MGGTGAIRDVIVVGLGPAGAGAAAMLRAPGAFGISGRALDVLAVEARGFVPTRSRVVALQPEALMLLSQADDLIGRGPASPTAPQGVATIAGIETTLRRALEHAGVDARYGARIVDVRDGGRAGVRVTFADGSSERARFLVDATGGRLGAFGHGEPTSETVYLTGQLPPRSSGGAMFFGRPVRVHGAGNDRRYQPVFGFNDARVGATAFVEYPSLPGRANDATHARRLLRHHLERSGLDPHGLRDAAFITTPHVRAGDAVEGSLIAVGDTARRVSPTTAAGVSNALEDARDAASAVQSTLAGPVAREHALAEYALAAKRR